MTTKKKAAKKAPKKSTKKSVKQAPHDAPGINAPAEAPPAIVTERKLKAGTQIHLKGSGTVMTLKGDATVEYSGAENDQRLVGMLARDATNFNLNIGSIEGKWNPVTARRVDDED